MKQRECPQERENYTDKSRYIINGTSNFYRIYVSILFIKLRNYSLISWFRDRIVHAIYRYKYLSHTKKDMQLQTRILIIFFIVIYSVNITVP